LKRNELQYKKYYLWGWACQKRMKSVWKMEK